MPRGPDLPRTKEQQPMVPFSKQMPTVIRPNQIGTDVTYEPPLRVGFGITDETVEGTTSCSAR